MITRELLDRVRLRLDDEIGDSFLWGNTELIDDYGNKAIYDMCRLCRGLLVDSNTVNEVLATGTITLAGASGSINSVSVNGVEITSAAVPFNGTIEQTYTDLASNITAATSAPNYTASASGAAVTVSAVSGTGSTPNYYEIELDLTTITATVVNMAGGTSVTRLYFVPDQAVYGLHAKVLEVIRVKPSLTKKLTKKTTAEMDNIWPAWEDAASGTPLYWISDQDNDKITIVPPPDTADTVKLTIYKIPLVAIADALPDNSPGIPEVYHADLIPQILHYAYMKADEETFRPKLSAAHNARFLGQIELINRELIKRDSTSRTNSTRKAFR